MTDSKPSKSARKREQLERQALGEELIALSDADLATMPVDDRLGEAIRSARTIRSHGALRRQKQLIGKLMRDVDPAPIRDRLQVSFQSDFNEVDHGWIKRFSSRLKDAPVTISVTLGETELSVEEFMHFAPGDVITLNQSTTQPLIATVEGMPKFLGYPGTTKGVQSFQIQDIIILPE